MPGTVTSDFATLEARQIDAYISLKREGKDVGTIDAEQYPATHRMAQKLATADGKATYAQRKHLSEAANGWIKRVLVFRQFSLQGPGVDSGGTCRYIVIYTATCIKKQ